MLEKEYVELARKVLVESIKFPTVLGEAYEQIVDYYSDVLSSIGAHVTVHRVADEYVRKVVPSNMAPDKPRFILLARIGRGRPVIQFNGHYDVVAPGDGWSTNPFEPLEREGRIYGRGATDMKGGIASVVAAVASLARREPNVTVEVALVPDEEIGGAAGTGYLVDVLGSRPDFVIIAEPSGIDNVYIGHRGNVWALVHVLGAQAHGSSPWLGDNAFERMLALASYMISRYKGILEGKASKYSYEDANASRPSATFGGLLKSAGSINVVPGRVTFSIDRRLIVEESVEEVKREIVALVEEASRATGARAEVEFVGESEPALTSPSSPFVEALSKAIEGVIGRKPSLTICTGGLDLRYYARRGIPSVAYGPGEVGLAHKANEYVRLDDVVKASEAYVKFVEALGG
ncbi:MAG: M20 family metallopeptidase [Desulfurococcaceae archaeon]